MWWGGGGGHWLFIKKKFLSLMIPYFLWSLVAILIGLPLVLLVNKVNGYCMFSGIPFVGRTFFDSLDHTFAIVRYGAPHYNCALWFLRSLFFLMLFAPLWRFLARRCRWCLICPLFFAVVYNQSFYIDLPRMELTTPTYFLIGVFCSTVSVKFSSIIELCILHIAVLGWIFCSQMRVPFALTSVCIAASFLPRLSLGRSYAFWIYCCQMPIIAYIISAFRYFDKSLPERCIVVVCIYFLTLFIAILSAKVVQGMAPKLYFLLTGGRVER